MAEPRFLGDQLRDGILAVLPDLCFITRSNSPLRCTTWIGATFENGAEWTAEMCCLPCRVRAVIDDVYPAEPTCTCSTDPLDRMPLIDGRCPVHARPTTNDPLSRPGMENS